MSTLRILCSSVGVLAVFCALGSFGPNASADIPDVVFEITAQSGGVVSTFEVTKEMQNLHVTQPNGRGRGGSEGWAFCLRQPVELRSGETLLGTISDLRISVFEDPEVNLNFAVQAGASDTTFHIASALLEFDTITNAEGRASAAVSVTDFNPFDGDAVLTGVGDTGGAYLAQYNGWAGNQQFPSGDPDPLGITFTEGIMQPVVATFGGTQTANHNVDWTAITQEDPYDMSSLMSFDLTANDLASGTSTFVIVPEPISLAVVLVGGLALLRRRS